MRAQPRTACNWLLVYTSICCASGDASIKHANRRAGVRELPRSGRAHAGGRLRRCGGLERQRSLPGPLGRERDGRSRSSRNEDAHK